MHVLVLSRYFPPSGEVGGFRAEGWSKYLPAYDIKLTILTPRDEPDQPDVTAYNENTEVVRFDYNDFNEGPRLLPTRAGALITRFLAFTSGRLKKNNFYEEALKLTEKHNFDCIIVTAPPFYILKLGELLHKKTGLPWVADSRDAWTTNRVTRGLGSGSIQNVYQSIEKKVLSSASFISTVSPTNVPSITKVNPSKAVLSVENGFFEDDIAPLPSPGDLKEGELRIAFLGTLYAYQPIEDFVLAVDEYAIENELKVYLQFIGLGKQKNATARVQQIAVSDRVEVTITPKLAREEALGMASACNAFLLLGKPGIDQLLTKIYDYLALRRPIIMYQDDYHYMGDMLRGFEHCFLCENQEDIKNGLRKIQENNFPLPQEADLFKFTRRHFTSVFAEKLLTVEGKSADA